MGDKTSILREMMSASIILALVTSLMYISGAAYLSAYHAQWGIESSLFTPSIQEALVLGSGNWFVGGIYIAIIGTIVGFIFYLSFYTLSELSKIRFVRNLASIMYEVIKTPQREEPEPPAILKIIIARSLQFLMLVGALLVLLFIFHQLIDFSSSQGAENAQREYVSFSKGKTSNKELFSRMKTLKIGGTEMEGYILASSNSMIAVYFPPSDNSQEQVTVIPLDSVSEIRAKKSTTEQAVGI